VHGWEQSRGAAAELCMGVALPIVRGGA